MKWLAAFSLLVLLFSFAASQDGRDPNCHQGMPCLPSHPGCRSMDQRWQWCECSTGFLGRLQCFSVNDPDCFPGMPCDGNYPGCRPKGARSFTCRCEKFGGGRSDGWLKCGPV